MAVVTKGTTISFANTPQAKDDPFTSTGLTEDLLGVKYLDVMGNDLGGNAKTLYSLDDGISPVIHTNPQGGTSPTDLLAKDAVGSVNTSALGAKIWITADGKVAYDASPIQAQLQYLAAGEFATDSFTYAIQLGNGTLSWANATVRIAGTNDAPVITTAAGGNAGTAVEAGNLDDGTVVAGVPDASGTLSSSDVDTGATATWSGSAAGTYGSFAISAGGAWTYALNNADGDTDALAEGASATDAFLATVTDDQGATATQLVTITITGTNDSPVVTTAAGGNAGAAVEAGNLDDGTVVAGVPAASGTLSSSDVDTGATATWSGSAAGNYGSFAISAGGAWTYALNNADADTAALAEGDSVTDTFLATVTDDKGATATQLVTITITGTNDAPVINSNTFAAAGAAQEDTTLSATGQLTAADVDDNATQAWSVVSANGTDGSNIGAYGSLAVDGTGKWTYTLNNGAPNVQALAAGESHDETFTIRVTDDRGATADQVVTVSVAGTNDAPTISSNAFAAAGAVQEDTTLVVTGQLAANDVDHGATETWTVQGPAAGTYGAIAVDASTGAWTYTLDNAAHQNLAQGESHDETFTVRVMDDKGAYTDQAVTVTVSGSNDAPVITSGAQSAAVTEIADLASGENSTTHVRNGTIAFSDVDTLDVHSAAVIAQGANYLGSFSLGTVAQAGDTVGWSFSVADGALDSLQAGQTLTQSYLVTVDDGHGGSASQTVKVSITGTNDAPVVAATDVTGAVLEAITPVGNLSDGGTIAFSDVDLADVHSVSAVTPTAGALGTLTAGVTTDTTGNGSGGVVSWNYGVAAAAVEYLAAGQSKVENFSFNVLDGQGGSVARTTSVTITGTNDAPMMALADTSGTVTARPAETGGGAPSPIVFTVQQYLGYQSNNLVNLRNYAATNQANYTVQTNVIDYTDDPGGFAGELPGSFRWPAAEAQNVNGTGATVNNNFFARITADFSVVTADTYTFRTFNDDGVFLLIDNNLVISDTGYHPEIAFNGSIALAPGNHSIELFFFENGGEASLEFSARSSTGSFGLVGASGGGLGGVAQVTDSGSLSFSDVDLTDVHLVSATPVGGVLGALSVAKNSDTTGTGTGGQLTWTYAVANSAIEYLAAGQTKVESFTVTLNDQHGGVITRQIDVTVTGTNDAPVISSSAQSGSVTEAINNSADEINNVVHQATGTLAFNDVDLTDAHTVTVSGNGASGYRGTLSANVANPSTGDGAGAIAWTFAVADGALDDLAQGQVLTQAYSVAVNDGHGGTASQNVVITLTGAADNSPPVAFNDNVTTNEDVPVTFSVVGNDTDVDGQTLSAANISALSNPALGTLQNIGGGQFSFSPATDASGTTSFTYQANDGQANSGNTATVTITVNPVNDPPVAVDDTASLTVTSLASQVHTNVVNWVNWTSNTITGTETINGISGAIGTVKGTIDLGSGQSVGVTYTGEYQFAQTDGATTGTPPGYPYGSTEHYYYTGTNVYSSASVANAPPDSDIIALNFANQTRTLTFSEPVENLYFAIVSMNGNGYVFDQDFSIVSSGAGYFGNGTFTHVDNHNGTYTVLGSGEPHGVLSINGTVGKLTWTSAANEFWNGFTVGTYGEALTGTATGNVLANDSDVEHDPLSVSAVNGQAIAGNSVTLTLPSGAELNVNRDGTYLYDENAAFASLGQGESRPDSFQYTVSDGHGGSATATVTVTVTGVNDAPVAATADVNGAVTELGIPVGNLTDSGTIAFSDVDLTDIHTVSVSAVGSPSGSLLAAIAPDTTGTGSGGQINWTYTIPAAALEGLSQAQQKPETFNLVLDDGHGGSVSRTVTVTLTGTNDAPIAVGDVLAATEDTPVTFTAAQLLGNDSDIDNLWTQLSIASVTSGTGGAAVLNGNGTVTFTPNANFNGAASFTYKTTDGSAQSAPATVTVNVAPVNDAPTLANGTLAAVLEDTANPPGAAVGTIFAGKFTDPDPGSSLAGVAIVGNTANPTTQGFWAYSTSNGALWFALPAVSGSSALLVSSNTLLKFVPAANFNGTPPDLVVRGLDNSYAGSFTVDASRVFINTTTNGGTTAIAATTATISTSVAPVNDAPFATNDGKSTPEDTPVTIDVLANDTDPDGDALSIVSVGGANHGTAQIVNNQILFTPTANFNATELLGYTISDGHGGTANAGIVVTVTPVNDAPAIAYTPVNFITNGSFEDPVAGAPGWSVSSGDIDRVHSSGWQAADGSYSLDLNGFYQGGVQQALATIPGAQYTVRFALSKNPGATDYATVQVSAAANSQSYTFSAANSGTDMKWSEQTFTFTATGPSTTLQFSSLYPTNNLPYPDRAEGPALDWVRISQTFTNEDVPTLIRGLSVSDLDAASDPIRLSLGVAHGTLALTNLTGLSGDTNGSDGVMTFTGSQAAINAALASGVKYTPALNYNGADTLSATVNDLGENGSGGALSATQSIALTVNPVNDAPKIAYTPVNLITNGSFEQPGAGVITAAVPGGSTAITGWTVTGNSVDYITGLWPNVDGSFSLDLDGNAQGGVRQTFVTAPGAQYTVTFAHGANASGGGNRALEVTAPGVANTYTLYNVTNVGWTQDSFTFAASGSASTLSFASLTPGASGPTLDAVSVVSNTVATLQNTAATIKGLGVSDLDAGSDAIQLNLAVAHGTLTLGSTAGLTVIDGNGSDGTLSYTGPQASINAALANGVVFTPSLNYNGADTLTATINDLGENGFGGSLSAVQLVGIAVVIG